MPVKVEKIDENTIKITNEGDAVITYYEFRGTPQERPVHIRPNESAVIKLKPERKRSRADRKARKSKVRGEE